MATQPEDSRSLWVYNPWLDLIVGCGAWSAPLLLLSYSSISASSRTWAVLFYALALFFNYPHYMATIYRAYHRPEDFRKYRVFTVHVTGLILLTLLLLHFWFRLLPWIFTIYLTWSPWHYSGQNYGLFMMFARRAGAKPDAADRRLLYGAFVVSYLILFLGFHTGASTDPLFVSLGIPAVISRWEQTALGIAFLALSVAGLSRLARQTGWRRLTPSLTLFSTQFLWFFLPAAISLIKGLEIPQSRYSSGVLAVMHSAQYLWITSYYARREATTEGETSRNWRPLAYFGVLIAGGIALFVPGPWLASRVFHRDFTASFLVFTALANIHHFILDGAVWKLRDGRIASLLLNTRERITDAAAEAGGRLARAWQWLTGNSGGAHAFRLSTALLLLVWGTVDQARYYFALHADNLTALHRAEMLDSYDGSLQMKLAQQAADSGRPQDAEDAWRKAMQINATDPAPRHALLRYLIKHKRFDEAYILSEASLRYLPKDADLLVDHGLLASQLGHNDEAGASWEKAIAIDPRQVNAHLFLADELDKTGNAQSAAQHYAMYLEKMSHQDATVRPGPAQVVAVVLRMADCLARASQTQQATISYKLAAKIAVQTRQPKLESVAEVNQAALEANAGHKTEALQLYQQALRLDDSLDDAPAAASDLLAYARFLNDQSFPPPLAYACVLQAERLAGKAPKTFPADDLAERKKQLESRLGAGASAEVRTNLKSTLQEALALR